MPSSRKNRGSRHRSHKQHQRHNKVEEVAGYGVDANLGHGPLPNIDSPEWLEETLPAWVEGPSVLKQDAENAEIASRGFKRVGHLEGGEDCHNATGFRSLSKRKKGEVLVFETEGGSSTPSSLDRWDGGDSRADEALSLLTSVDSARGGSHGLDFKSFKASVARLDAVGSSAGGHEVKEYKGESDGKYRKGKAGANISSASKTIMAVDLPGVGHPDVNLGDSSIRIKNRIARRRDLSEVVEQESEKFTFDIEPNTINSSKGQQCESNASDSGKTSAKKGSSARRSDKDGLRREMSLAAQYSHSPDADGTLGTEQKKGKLGDAGISASLKPKKSEEYQKTRKSEETQRYRKSDDAATGDNTATLEERLSFPGEVAKCSTGFEWAVDNDNRNPELEKELENRIRRRRGESGDRDRWRDDERDREAKRRHHQRDHYKKEEKYKDESRNRDDKLRDERSWDEKTKDDRERSIGRHRDEKDREGRNTEDKQVQDKQEEERQKCDRESNDRYKDDTEREERHRADKGRSDRHLDDKHKDKQRDDKGKNDKDRDARCREDRDGRRKDDKPKDSKHKSEKEREDRQKDNKTYNEWPRAEKHKDERIKIEKDHIERSKAERDCDDGICDENDRFVRQKVNDNKVTDKDGNGKQRVERSRLEEDGASIHKGETSMCNRSRDEKHKYSRNKNGKDQVNSIGIDKHQEEKIRVDKDPGDKEKYGRYKDDRDENAKKRENKNKDERLMDYKERETMIINTMLTDGDKFSRMRDERERFESPNADKDMLNKRKNERDNQCQNGMPRDESFTNDKDALEKQNDVKVKHDWHRDGTIRSGMHKDDKNNNQKHRDENQGEDRQCNAMIMCGEEQIQSYCSHDRHEIFQKQNKQNVEQNKNGKHDEVDCDATSGHDESLAILSKQQNELVLPSQIYEHAMTERTALDNNIHEINGVDQNGAKDPREGGVSQERTSAMPASSDKLDASVRGPWSTWAQEFGSGDSVTKGRDYERQGGAQREPEGRDSHHEVKSSKDERDSSRTLELPREQSRESDDDLIMNRVDQMLGNYAMESQAKSISPPYEIRMSPQNCIDSSPGPNCWSASFDAQRSPSPSVLEGKHSLSLERSGRRNKFDTSISVSSSSGTRWQREGSRHSSDHMDLVTQHIPGEEGARSWETRILHREPDDTSGRSLSPERVRDSHPFPGARPLLEEDFSRGLMRGSVIERDHRLIFSQAGVPTTVRRAADVTRERIEWTHHGMEMNRQLNNPIARPQLTALPAHPSGPSGLLPPPPPFRPGIDNPAVLGPSNAFEALGPRGSGRYERRVNHYKRAEMGQAAGPGDVWRGVGSWNVHTQGPGPNMFSRFPPQVGVHPSSYIGIGHQFPVPPLFGMGGARPSTERGFPGGRFHVGDTGASFHGSGPAMGWRRPGELDDACPPHQGHLDMWDGKGPYADNHQRYGRHDWDQGMQGIIRRGWEQGSEMWQSHRMDVDVGFNASHIERDTAFQGNFGREEPFVSSQGQQMSDQKLPLEMSCLERQEEKGFGDRPPASISGAMIVSSPQDVMESSKRAFASKQILLSNLDVSFELAGGKLYRQYMNLLPASEAKMRHDFAMEDDFDEAAADESDLELDLEAEILLSALEPHSQFLPPVSQTIFKATLDLYKRPVSENHIQNSTLGSLFPDTDTESSQSMKVHLESIADQVSSPQVPDVLHAVTACEGSKDVYIAVEDLSCFADFPVTEVGPEDNDAVPFKATVIRDMSATETVSIPDIAKGNAEGFYFTQHDQVIMHQEEVLLENYTLCLGDTATEYLSQRSTQDCESEAAGSIPQGAVVQDIPDQLRSIAIEIDKHAVFAERNSEGTEESHIRIEVHEQAVLAEPVLESHGEARVPLAIVNSCNVCDTETVIVCTTRSPDQKSIPSELLSSNSSLCEGQAERGVSEAQLLREGCVREQTQDGGSEEAVPLLGGLEDNFGMDGMSDKSKPQQSPQLVCESTH